LAFAPAQGGHDPAPDGTGPLVSAEAAGATDGVARPGHSALSSSVVICAYTLDRWDQLVVALAAAVNQDPGPLEVLLVVDHNAELADRARVHLGSLVRVVENAHRRGLSGARNTGVEAATGDIVVFLDDDAVPAPGWVDALTSPFADPRVAATGGVARPAWAEGRPAWFPHEFDWVVGCSYRGQPSPEALDRTGGAPGSTGGVVEVRNPLGCNMAFRRLVFADIGGFRDDVGRVGRHPLGCEETELCIRLRQQRPEARIVLTAGAVVDHHVTPDRHRFDYFRRRCFAEGISKAVVTDRVGAGDGLASERSYVTRALPRGVADGLRASVRGRDLDGARRSGAIVAGLALTAAGYARGRLAGTPVYAGPPLAGDAS
jgi:GT2 family glycosyltransferase